ICLQERGMKWKLIVSFLQALDDFVYVAKAGVEQRLINRRDVARFSNRVQFVERVLCLSPLAGPCMNEADQGNQVRRRIQLSRALGSGQSFRVILQALLDASIELMHYWTFWIQRPNFHR